MALQKPGQSALAVRDDFLKEVKTKGQPEKKKVLDEDTYTEHIEKIIVRDFFPDLPKLQAQSDYLDAVRRNDVVKLRELHIKYASKKATPSQRSLYSTPATFETPETRQRDTPDPSAAATESSGEDGGTDERPTHNPEPDPRKAKAELRLDQYLAKNTSEDNASFGEILEENERKLRQKHSWLHKEEEEKKEDKQQALALPSIQRQAIEGPRTQELQTWEYTSRNSLMYIPDGVDFSAKEKIELQKKQREILHKNTRFEMSPFDTEKSKDDINQAVQAKALIKEGRIGVDGKEIFPSASPSVNGFGFVGTPSPAPGVNESPLMTWGEIEGTPFRLDASDTPVSHTPGPTFKIPQIPNRDRLAHKLAEDASKAHRSKKQDALKRFSALAGPSPKFGSSRTERLHSMSPAAQRLASSKLGVRTHTDKALRASYTPSPSHTPGSKTSLLTPGLSPKPSTPHRTPGKRTPSTNPISLTDNLLNIPKRQKASDFF